jgi:hypothetical protein
MLRRWLTGSFLSLLTCLLVFAQQVNLTGKWEIKVKLPDSGQEIPFMILELTQTGDALAGKVVASLVEGIQVKDFSFDGKELKFALQFSQKTTTYTGKLVEGKFEGTAKEESATTNWVAARTERTDLALSPPDAFRRADRTQDPAERIKALEKFIQDHPKSALVAQAYSRLFDTVLEMSPDDKAKVLEYVDQYFEASPDLAKPAVHNEVAWELAVKGLHLDEAERISKKSLELLKETAPSGERAAYTDTLGWIYYKKKMYPEAEKYLKEAVALDPDSGELLGHLGKVYEDMGQVDEALKYYLPAAVKGADRETRKALEALYKQRHGSLAGLHEMVDRELAKKPAPFDPGDYEPTTDRTKRVALVEAFSGAG